MGARDEGAGGRRQTGRRTSRPQRLGRSPRPSELAAELDVAVEDVLRALDTLESYRTTSLDLPDPQTGHSLAERVGEVDGSLDLVDHRGDLRRLVDGLPERERTVLLLRFYGEQTQTQIAERMGLSPMHVSRLLSRTLARLRVGSATETQPP